MHGTLYLGVIASIRLQLTDWFCGLMSEPRCSRRHIKLGLELFLKLLQKISLDR